MCQFLPHSKVTQSHLYTYLPFLILSAFLYGRLHWELPSLLRPSNIYVGGAATTISPQKDLIWVLFPSTTSFKGPSLSATSDNKAAWKGCADPLAFIHLGSPPLWDLPGVGSFVWERWGFQGWHRSTGNVLWLRPVSGSFPPVVTFLELNNSSGKWTPGRFFCRNTESAGSVESSQLRSLQYQRVTVVLPISMIYTYVTLMLKLLM